MQAPQWFVDALAMEPALSTVEAGGATIAVKSWGRVDAPAVVLVHGGAAHCGWWDHVAPLLATRSRVVALDVSGHGGSGSRDAYAFDTWADEVRAVIVHSGFAQPPTVIGHSMGGWVSMAAVADPVSVGGVAVKDTPLRNLSPEQVSARNQLAFGPSKVYSTPESALARHRTVPPQPYSLPYVVDCVAAQSLKHVTGGWSWKVDPEVFADIAPHEIRSEEFDRVQPCSWPVGVSSMQAWRSTSHRCSRNRRR